MSEVTEQLRKIEDLRNARYITGTLRDISSIEIRQVREDFDRNTRFSAELSDLYRLVWRFAERAGTSIRTTGRNRVLNVAYTTNRHFYGSLNYDIVRSFMRDTATGDQCLIIGDTGKELWLSNAKKRKEISFLSFKEDTPTFSEIQDFLQRTSTYDRVFVYYPGFVSVFIQEPRVLDVTFRPTPSETKLAVEDSEIDKLDAQYLLEPDITEMLEFFNTQVRYVLFERMLLETRLSRVAARLVKMDTADQNAEALIGAERRELRRAKSSFSSRRMIETLVGYLQWHTH